MKSSAKWALSLLLLLSCTGQAKSSDLQDVSSYDFDPTKLAAAADSFHFLRSYVDYFYLLIQANRPTLTSLSHAESVPGWCVGDAHAENFGAVILADGTSMFTMNDMDDSGPCPIPMDLMRLLVSTNLYDSTIDAATLLKNYVHGLQGDSVSVPSAISDIMSKSQKKGQSVSSSDVVNNKIVRTQQMREVTSDESSEIEEIVSKLSSSLASQYSIIDEVATSKVGGGSGGLLRFEVLIDNGGTQLHLELKEEVQPSIYPVAIGDIPGTASRIATTLKMDQTDRASTYYGVSVVSGHQMLMRPRFAGNVGVTLTKQSASDNKDIIAYEAYQLGVIHARSVHNISDWVNALSSSYKDGSLQNDIDSLAQQFNQKFKQLK